jgi:hypothetical protein
MFSVGRGLLVSVAVLSAILVCRPARAADQASIGQPAYLVGDSWVYDRSREIGKKFSQERVDLKIDRVGDETMLVGFKLDGSPNDFDDQAMGLDMSGRAIVDGQQKVTARLFSFPMKVGDKWTEDFVDPRRKGIQTSAHVTMTYKVVGWEDVTVPAGTFHALKIEGNGLLTAQVFFPAKAIAAGEAGPSDATSISHVQTAHSGTMVQPRYRLIYYAPQIKNYVKLIYEQYDDQNVRNERDTFVLVSYTPAK